MGQATRCIRALRTNYLNPGNRLRPHWSVAWPLQLPHVRSRAYVAGDCLNHKAMSRVSGVPATRACKLHRDPAFRATKRRVLAWPGLDSYRFLLLARMELFLLSHPL